MADKCRVAEWIRRGFPTMYENMFAPDIVITRLLRVQFAIFGIQLNFTSELR